MQTPLELANRIAKLSPSQRAILENWIEELESCSSQPPLTLDQAIEEFEREHPELLCLLAQ